METWVEITEVIWIKKLLYVRLLAETWIEISILCCNSLYASFVSLRRRELKFHYYGSVLLHSGSSPCGDVSCNTESAFKEHLKEGVRSLAEMWVEIVYLAFMRSLPGVLRLRKETWIEIPVPNKMLAKKSVRLRKETWIEILQLYIWKSPCDRVGDCESRLLLDPVDFSI